MAGKWLVIVCVVAIWATEMGSSSHHGGAPAPSVDCTSLVFTLSDCLSFVNNGSRESRPKGTCCSALKTVLHTAPYCLCQAFSSSAQLGISINITKAVTLPSACKLSTPSSANCALSVTPAPGSSPTSATLNGLSPRGAPSSTPGNAASALIPFSTYSFVVSLIVALSFISI